MTCRAATCRGSCIRKPSKTPQPQALVRPAQLPAFSAPTSSPEPEEPRGAEHEAPALHDDGQPTGEAPARTDHLRIPSPLESELDDLPGGDLPGLLYPQALETPQPQALVRPAQLPAFSAPTSSPEPEEPRGAEHEAPALHDDGQPTGEAPARTDHLRIPSPLESELDDLPGGDLPGLLYPQAPRDAPQPQALVRPCPAAGVLQLRRLLRSRGAARAEHEAPALHDDGQPTGEAPAETDHLRIPSPLESELDDLPGGYLPGLLYPQALETPQRRRRHTEGHTRDMDRRIEWCATSYAIRAATSCFQAATLCTQAATSCFQAATPSVQAATLCVQGAAWRRRARPPAARVCLAHHQPRTQPAARARAAVVPLGRGLQLGG